MSLTKLTENLNNVSSLPDKPTLATEELKKVFDEAGNTIKKYLNDTLTVEVDKMETEIKKLIQTNTSKIEDNKKNMWDLIYPIGSIYMSINETSPETLFGGKWEEWAEGRVPVGINKSDIDFDSTEKKGGNKTHNHGNTGASTGNTGSHALKISEIPLHDHYTTSYSTIGYATGNTKRRYPVGWNDTGKEATWKTSGVGGGEGHTHSLNSHTHTTSNASLLQPYITCYMWKRIS